MKSWCPLILVSLVIAPLPAVAQANPSGAQPNQGALKKFDDLVKDAVQRPGFLETYEKGENLYLVIPKDQLKKDFLMEFKIAQGVGTQGLFGGTILNLFEGDVVALERHGDRVFLVQRPHRFTAAKGGALAKAVELTFSQSVVESAKIEAIRDDSALVVNIYDWIVSDLSNIGQRVRQAVWSGYGELGRQSFNPRVGRLGQATFERSKSYLESVKAFPRNVNLRAKLTFRPQEAVNWPSVPDGRYISLSLHYTLAALPESPMEPRVGDDRVGNFWTVHKDFSQDDSSAFVRYANRWRLEPGTRVGQLVIPKQPIVFYIDRTVPEEYRPALKAGVEAWNRAFEAAGWKDAIRADLLPEGADAEDIRYATLRWNVSDAATYGAIGASVVDPRTGEVLDADVLFEASMITMFRNFWRTQVNPVSAALAFTQAIDFPASETAFASPGSELASFGTSLVMQGGFLQAVLAARGEIAPGTPVPTSYVNQAIKWVTMHEVGHTLGLHHNFRASASTPFAKLHDRQWAEQNGIASSVMDYPGLNVRLRGTPNDQYYDSNVGSYDLWAIAYTYTPDAARARELARQAADPAHLFGTDPDAYASAPIDPSINPGDLSDDPLAWGRESAQLVRTIMDSLPRFVLADNTRYHEVTVAFQTLMGLYANALSPAVKYLGGQYLNRDHAGDPNGRLPFVNVPRAKQREALDFVIDAMFSPRALVIPPSVLTRFGPNRWTQDWGTDLTWNGRLDYPFHEQTLALQRAVLNQVVHPLRLARIRDAETKFGAANVLTIPELMSDLTKAIWTEVATAPSRSVTAMRRDLQRAYLDALTNMVLPPSERMPADARAVARMELTRLDRRIAARLASLGGLDAYTLAHLQESRARIKKTLEAGLEVERERGTPRSG